MLSNKLVCELLSFYAAPGLPFLVLTQEEARGLVQSEVNAEDERELYDVRYEYEGLRLSAYKAIVLRSRHEPYEPTHQDCWLVTPGSITRATWY